MLHCFLGLYAMLSVATLVAAPRPSPWSEMCLGLVDGDGVAWDVVRADLAHVLQQTLGGALGRDLLASKDKGGRDPAHSYGDVQLQRHLERLRQLVERVGAEGGRACPVGWSCLNVFVSIVYSGLPWGRWYDYTRKELWGLVHDSNWTQAVDAGWPILELFGVLSFLRGETKMPRECRRSAEDARRLGAVPALLDEGRVGEAARLGRAARCPFGEAVAAAAEAAARAAASTVSWPFSLDRVQAAVRRAAGVQEPIATEDLLAAPLPALMSRLATRLQRGRARRLVTTRLDIVYCGHAVVQEEQLRKLCGGATCVLHFHLTASREESLSFCYTFYRKAMEDIGQLSGGHLLSASTLLLSPLTWQWNDDLSHDVGRLLVSQARWRNEISLAGLPVLNRSRIFNWPVQRLRHQYWKLAYSLYATGHETVPQMTLAQDWAVGDVTSGTRVYSTATLLSLVGRLAAAERLALTRALPEAAGASEALGAAAGAAEWFVALDVIGKEVGVRAYTMLAGQSMEDSYRAYLPALSRRFSRTFHVESARLLPGAPPLAPQCLFPTSKQAAAFSGEHGTVVSWCTRKRLQRMFQVVGGWWLGLNPRGHIIVPVSASVLNIFRSGDLDLFPWDADIDANFIANHPVVLGTILEGNRSVLASLGYDFILRGDRAVIKDVEDTARMDIWFSGPQSVDAYDIRARMCGVRVHFFRDQLEGTVLYYRPAEKINGNSKGELLNCRWAGHNACLPDCVRGGRGVGPDGCEFPDRFVHLDE